MAAASERVGLLDAAGDGDAAAACCVVSLEVEGSGDAAPPEAAASTLWGHPRGLFVLLGTEVRH